MDKRIPKIAKILVEHCIGVKKGQTIQLTADILARPLVLEIYKLIIQKGAYPILRLGFDGLSPIYYKYASDEQLKNFPKIAYYEIKNVDSTIHIVAPEDRYELASVDSKRIAMRSRAIVKIDEVRRNKTWVLFYYPTASYAKDAGMSLKEWENFVFNSCMLDWKKEKPRMEKIKKVLDAGDKVRIIAKDTDLSFSIKNRNAVVGWADGHSGENVGCNLPDGEVFTAPKENTVNGKISFTYPTVIKGKKISGIKAEFKNGKLVKIKADKNLNVLKELLKTDKGASKLGELGIGCNKNITRFVYNTLFDEKIYGTIHIAFGLAYEDCKGTNKSASHKDLVLDLRPSHGGGGEVWVDKTLLIKDGKFQI